MGIQEAIRKLANTNDQVYSLICKVKSVSGNTCDVTPVNGDADILEVRIFPSDAKSGLLLKPRVGSIVIVTFLNKNQAFISMTSEIESISVKNTLYDLSKVMDEFVDVVSGMIDAMNRLVVNTPAGPSAGLGPNSVADFQKSKVDLNLFKNKLNNILKPFE